MKITELRAENFKRLKLVRITPGGDPVITVTGKNGAGKSSVLDAVLVALAGKRAMPSKPVRKGEAGGSITLRLGDKFVVHRSFTDADSSLTVTSADGAKYSSPQALLDDLVGAISFDPLAFSRLKPRDQYDELLKTVKLDVDVDKLKALNAEDYAARTTHLQRQRDLEGAAKAVEVPDGTPDEPVDEQALVRELKEVGERNGELNNRRSRREQLAGEVRQLKERETELIRQAEGLEAKANVLRQDAQALAGRRTVISDKLSNAAPLPENEDTQPAMQKIAEARAINLLVAQKRRCAEALAAAEEQRLFAVTLTERRDARSRQIVEALMKVELPAGVTLGDGELLLNGLPLDQASEAERLRLSVAVAMAANPTLRVLRVREGSVLDEDGLKLLEELAVAGDYQVWLERVDSSGQCGIVMIDGEVAPHG